jgi:nucleoid-associated protein YgaU
MLADDKHELRDLALAGDDIEGELAFLAGILAEAGDADVETDGLASIEMLRDEGAIATPRPRYQRRGPVLTQVAAVGLVSFPAALTPLPAFATTPLPPNLAIAMATRPPAPPAGHSSNNELFPFSRSMQDVRTRAQLGLPPSMPSHPIMAQALPHAGAALSTGSALAANGLQMNPRLKKLFSQQRKVAVTTKHQFASTFYQVSNGDSLYSIASDLLGSGNRWREIYEANHHRIGAGYMLRPGQKLTIPTPRAVPDVKLAHFKTQPGNSPKLASGKPAYMVSRGDNLYRIAAKRLHNANRWREIVSLNKAILNGKTVIYPNQWLLLPPTVT